MGRKKEVKLEDISNKLGVSIVTVSNALKGKKGVSDTMRAKILKAAQSMGYQIQKEEQQQSKTSYMIGIIVAEKYVKEFPSFYMDIYKYIAQEATKRGSLTVLEIIDESKEKQYQNINIFLNVNVNGIIIIGQLDKNYIHAVKCNYKVPVVCVDYYDTEEGIDYIITDGYGGTEKIVNMLIQCGYRCFQFVGTPQATHNIMDRYMGYCKALEKHNLQSQQKNLLYDRDYTVSDYRLDVEVPDKLPEVFVCNCDKTAKILAEKLARKSINIPKDVAITGFDNFHPQLYNGLYLTTYENDEKIIARISVSTMLKRLSGKEAGGIRIVEGRIIEGDTVLKKGSEIDGRSQT